MADVIQCPTCSKKFRLPERPPAVFTCTGCGTAMDLSSFRAAAAAAPVAVPAAEEAPAKTSRRSSATRAHGARTSRTSASRGARARRGAAAPAEDGDDAGGRLAPPKDNSKTILVASLIGLVVVGGIGFLALRKKEPPAATPKDSASTAPSTPEAGSPPPESSAAPEGAAPSSPTAPGATPAAPGATPAAPDATPAAPAMGDAAAPPRTTSPTASLGKVLLHEVGHHPESTDAEKQKIDDLIKLAVFENAGRDSLEAGEALVAMGLKAAPRLINVFNTVQTTDGFDSRLGLVKAGVADGLLRKIDGAIDRQKQRPTRIMPASKPDYAQGVAKRWVRWWDSEGWKTPQKPWDERIDGAEKEGGEVEPGS